jgi:O-antigen/teichoic acid export membrane protein
MTTSSPASGLAPEDASPVTTRVHSSPATAFNRKAILWNTAHVAGATYASRGLAALRSFINARFLGPELYGFWGWLSMLLSFGYYAHAGVQEIVARDVPAARSRGQVAEAQHIAQLGFSWFLPILAVATAAQWLIAVLLPAGTPLIYRAGWMVSGVVMPLEIILCYERVVAKAEERFQAISRSLFIATIVSLVLTVALVTRFRMAGFLVVAILTPLVNVWLLRGRGAYPWGWTWSWPRLRGMIRAGWPILLMVVVFEAMGWIDRALVSAFVGIQGFGYYTLGALLAHCCSVVPEVMAMVIEPNLYFNYARHGEALQVREHVWFPVRTLAYLMPLGLALGDLLVPLIVRAWLPAYIPGIGVMRVLMWATCFTGLAVCTRSLVVALNRTGTALRLYGVAIALNTALGLLAGWQGRGLVGIALSTLVASLVCSTLLLGFALHTLGWSWRTTARRLALLYTPVALAWIGTVWLPELAARAGVLNPAQLIAARIALWAALAAAVAWRLREHAQRDDRADALRLAPIAGARMGIAT